MAVDSARGRATPTVATSRAPRRGAGALTGRSAGRSLATWLAAPCAVLAALYAEGGFLDVLYPLDRQAAVNSTLLAVAPFVAVSAAWEMDVLRRLWGRVVVGRPWWHVLAGRVRLPALLGLAIVVLGHAAAAAWPSWGWAGWSYPFLSVLAVLAWTAAGAAIGLTFRSVLALPIAIMAPFLTMTLPHGWEPTWLRHLTGVLESCCSTSDVLDPRAVEASLAVLAAMLVVSLCVAYVRLLPAGAPLYTVRVAGAVALLGLIGAVAAVSPVRDLGPSATQDRPLTELVCEDDVCLWPEDEVARGVNEAARERVLTGWAELGLPPPPSKVAPVPAPGTLALAIRTDDADLGTRAMAAALPREALGCRDDYTDDARNRVLDQLAALLLTRVGGDLHEAGLAAVALPEPAEAPALWASVPGC